MGSAIDKLNVLLFLCKTIIIYTDFLDSWFSGECKETLCQNLVFLAKHQFFSEDIVTGGITASKVENHFAEVFSE